MLTIKVLQIIYDVNQEYVDSLKSDKDVLFLVTENDNNFELGFDTESIFNEVASFELELAAIK